MTFSVGFHSRAESGALDDVEFKYAGAVRKRKLQHDLVRPVLPEQLRIVRHRFDMNAAPSLLVKSLADGIHHGMLRADVDIDAGRYVLQRPPEHDVLEILRVRGEDLRAVFLSHLRLAAGRCPPGRNACFRETLDILQGGMIDSWHDGVIQENYQDDVTFALESALLRCEGLIHYAERRAECPRLRFG